MSCQSIDIQSMEPNYYEMLNVPRLASVVEMRQGLRKASLQHHPDKTDDGTFLELREAYDVCIVVLWYAMVVLSLKWRYCSGRC